MSKKVVFSLRKDGSSCKITGCGFAKDNVLFLKVGTKPDGTKKWFVVDDYNKYLFPVIGKQGEYKGYYTEYHEDTLIPSKNGSYDTRDTETDYFIWFKELAK